MGEETWVKKVGGEEAEPRLAYAATPLTILS